MCLNMMCNSIVSPRTINGERRGGVHIHNYTMYRMSNNVSIKSKPLLRHYDKDAKEQLQ